MTKTVIIAILTLLAQQVSAQSVSDKSKRKRPKLPVASQPSYSAPMTEGASSTEDSSPSPYSEDDFSEQSEQSKKSSKQALVPKQNSSITNSDWSIRGPSWMFGLGINAIPDTPFDSTMIDSAISISQGTLEYKSTDSDGSTTLKAKPQYGTLSAGFSVKNASKKLVWGANFEIDRSIFNTDGTLALTVGNTAQMSIKDKTDTPRSKSFVSIQAKPGLWIGLSSGWKKIFRKIESKATVESTTLKDTVRTTRSEASVHTAGLEYISPTGQAGVEYKTETSQDSIENSWTFPLRFSLSESLFAGASLSSSQSDDMNDMSKTSGHTFQVEAGQQNSSSAHLISYAYTVEKSISAASSKLNKTNTTTIASIFGPPKGTRVGGGFVYSVQKETEGAESQTDMAFPALLFYVTRVN
jgi:hypothetical protein